MTVAPVSPLSIYNLAGTALGPFASVWPYEIDADIGAFLALPSDPALIQLFDPADYTVASADPLTGGGNVTLTAGMLAAHAIGGNWPVGAQLVLIRQTGLDQPSAFGEEMGFSPSECEAALDHVERQVQDAKALAALGIYFGANLVLGAALGLVNGFANVGAPWSLAQARKHGGGLVTLAGYLSCPANPNGKLITTLPAGFRPIAGEIFLVTVIAGAFSAGALHVLADGTITYFGDNAATQLVLSGLNFQTEPF